MEILYNIATKQVVKFYDTTGKISATGSMPAFQIFNDLKSMDLSTKEYSIMSWIDKNCYENVLQDFYANPTSYKVLVDHLNVPVGIYNEENKHILKSHMADVDSADDIPIVWSGMFFNSISYSLINRKIVLGLKDRGFKIYVCAIKANDYSEVPLEEKIMLEAMGCYEMHLDKKDSIRVYCYLPIERTPPALYNIAYTMMETNSVKDSLVSTLNMYNDECWFPCFKSGTFIATDSRYLMPIESIKNNQKKLLTHNGRFCSIKNRSIKEYSGNLLSVWTYMREKHFICTPEHPFVIAKQENDTSMPKIQDGITKQAKLLKNSDWLFYKRRLSENGIKTLNLLSISKTNKPVSRYDNLTFKISDGKLLIYQKKDFYNHMTDKDDFYHARLDGSGEIDVSVDVDNKLIFLLSTYIVNRELKFPDNRKDTVRKFLKLSKEVFGENIKIKYTSKNDILTIELSDVLSIILEMLCLPIIEEEEFLDKDVFDMFNEFSFSQKRCFLESIYLQTSTSSSHYRLRLFGEKLVQYYCGFLMDLGIAPRLTYETKNHNGLDCTYAASISIPIRLEEYFKRILSETMWEKYGLRRIDGSSFEIIEKDYCIDSENIFLRFITKTKIKVEEEKVFNFEVSTDNTYTANLICTHNCNFNVDKFKESGLQKHVERMPLAYDDKLFYPDGPKINWEDLNLKIINMNSSDYPSTPTGKVFLAVFRYSYRKGPDVLIKSFRRAFRASDNVSLVIFSRHYLGNIKNDEIDTISACENDMKKWLEDDKDAAPIYWSNEFLEASKMPDLFRACDYFVSTSRGEGFGLTPIEASACGLPVIAPDHSAFSDYMTPENGFVIKTDKFESCGHVLWRNGKATYVGTNPEWMVWITDAFADQEFPVFGEETCDEVCSIMRHVYENPSIAEEKAKNMLNYVKNHYTWDKCIDKMADRLRELQRKVYEGRKNEQD